MDWADTVIRVLLVIAFASFIWGQIERKRKRRSSPPTTET